MSAIEDLEKLQDMLVNERRKLVARTISFETAGTAPDDLVKFQQWLNAVMSAIKDEKSREPSVYEDPATTV